MKKIIAVLITVLAIISVGFAIEQHMAQADTIHWTYQVGYDYDLPGGYDAGVECVHTNWQNSSDTYVVLGMQAWYDVDLYNNYGLYGYEEGQWTFEAGYGYNYDEGPNRFYNNIHSCTYNVNYGAGWYGTQFYDDQFPCWWESGVKLVRCYYPNSWSHMTFSPDAHSISGQSYGAFYNPSNPGNIWYLSASPPPECSYDILTAQAGPPHTYSWDD